MISQELLQRIQWNGTYGSDFHQDFSTVLSYMMFLDYDGGRDLESESFILESISHARSYKKYLEDKADEANTPLDLILS